MKSLTPNLMVADVNATAAFYRDNFDFAILDTVPDFRNPDSGQWQFAILGCGEAVLMLQNTATFTEEFADMAHQPSGGTFTLYIKVEDVRGLFERVKDVVAYIRGGLYDTFYGTTEFTIRDPNGYFLTFSQDNSGNTEGV